MYYSNEYKFLKTPLVSKLYRKMTTKFDLQTAKDIIPLAKSPSDNTFIYAIPIIGDLAEKVFNYASKRINDFSDDPMFKDRYFQLKETKAGKIITGSNTGLAILCNDGLPEGLWLPTISQARILDKQRKLSNGVCRDCGVAVYNDSIPNQELAKHLIEQAKQRGFTDLPLLFSNCDLTLKGQSGQFKPELIQNPKGTSQEQEAKDVLEKMYQENSGARRVYRNYSGNWGVGWVGWDGPDYSYCSGRVDYACGEATCDELTEAYEEIVGDNFTKQIEALVA